MVDLTENCVGHWNHNDNADDYVVHDDSGNNNHGTSQRYTSVLHKTTQCNPNLCPCLFYDYSTDYVTVGDLVLSGTWSLSAWIYLQAVPTYTPRIIVWFNSNSYIAVNTSQKLIVYINGNTIIIGTTTIEIGQWYLVALTTNGENYNLYLDNESEGSNTSIGISLSDVMFSTSASPVFWRWHGRLDCIGTFDKVLNADERAFLWNNGDGTEKLKEGLARPLVGGSLVGNILVGKGLA